MKLTMTFEAQTEDESDQLMTIQGLLKEHPIGRVAMIPNGPTVTIADEPPPATETETIAVIKAAMERLDDYEARQRVLAWAAQLANQAGVTVS